MLDVLIIEDDAAGADALRSWLERMGLGVRAAGDVAAGRRAIAERLPDLALVDLELPDGSGLELLKELGAAQDVEVVMISGRTTVEAAIDAMRLGARDFLTKPVDTGRLAALVQRLTRTAKLHQEVHDLRAELRRLGRFGQMVGVSKPMQAVYEQIERVAPTDESVFVLGETGTGKELVASTIHRLGRRGDGPFVAVNCGAVPANLLESQFFGHERGAFTGADRRHKGFFEQAHGGTLFLDEVTEMPLELQVKLLRVLQENRVTRLGGSREIEVDVRIVAASNRDPQEAIDEGKLRQDLLYRLLVFPIELPPLRERGEDVVLLARAFLDQLNAEQETTKRLSDAALERLGRHDWPGNVRELDNVVRRAFVMADTHIGVDDLPLEGRGEAPGVEPAGDDGGSIRVPLGATVKQAEQRLIEATLEHLGGNKKETARTLGIGLKTLYGRLKLYEARRSGG